MSILDLLIALDDEGFPELFNCEGEVVIFGDKPHVPPDLALQVRLNKEELLPMLKKVGREQLTRILQRTRPMQQL